MGERGNLSHGQLLAIGLNKFPLTGSRFIDKAVIFLCLAPCTKDLDKGV